MIVYTKNHRDAERWITAGYCKIVDRKVVVGSKTGGKADKEELLFASFTLISLLTDEFEEVRVLHPRGREGRHGH